MRSPQIEKTIETFEERRKYSNLQVLKSAAGYYIGTLYCEKGYEPDGITPKGGQEPGSRDSSCYFANQQDAITFLEKLRKGDTQATFSLRLEP